MNGRVSPRFVEEYLREIGIDFLPVPRPGEASASPRGKRGGGPDPAKGPGGGGKTPPDGGGDDPRKLPKPGETLDDIRRDAEECRCCPLCKSAKNVVFGVGNPHARLMFIGEGPGAEEDRQGEPFVGAAGKRLNQWIGRLGLAREDVYIGNIVKCRPPENRVPTPEEAAACLPYLRRQIDAIRPEVICTLGATALNHLLDLDERITKMHGTWRSYKDIPVFPIYHPAFVLRDLRREEEVFRDLDVLAAKLGLPG